MDTLIDRIRKNATWALVLGVLLIIGGIAAMTSPLLAGSAVALMVGWLLLISGVFQVLFAFWAKAGVMALVLGVLTTLAGGYLVANPGVAIASLVMFLALYLLLSGVSEAVLAFAARPEAGWGWLLFNAVVSILLGAVMFFQFPLTGAIALGLLLGFKLLATGLVTVVLSMTVRKALKPPPVT